MINQHVLKSLKNYLSRRYGRDVAQQTIDESTFELNGHELIQISQHDAWTEIKVVYSVVDGKVAKELRHYTRSFRGDDEWLLDGLNK